MEEPLLNHNSNSSSKNVQKSSSNLPINNKTPFNFFFPLTICLTVVVSSLTLSLIHSNRIQLHTFFPALTQRSSVPDSPLPSSTRSFTRFIQIAVDDLTYLRSLYDECFINSTESYDQKTESTLHFCGTWFDDSLSRLTWSLRTVGDVDRDWGKFTVKTKKSIAERINFATFNLEECWYNLGEAGANDPKINNLVISMITRLNSALANANWGVESIPEAPDFDLFPVMSSAEYLFYACLFTTLYLVILLCFVMFLQM